MYAKRGPACMFIFIRNVMIKLPIPYTQTFGLIWSTGLKGTPPGWTTTRHTTQPYGKELLTAALKLATNQAGLTGVVTVRIQRGVEKLPPLQGFKASELWLWLDDQQEASELKYPTIFEAAPEDLQKPITVKNLAKELEEVQLGRAYLEEVCLSL